jgi:hypothetical protein
VNALRSQLSWTHYRTLIRIGILLCTDKNDAVVKITLPENNNTIIASKYQLYLPTEQQLIEEVKKEIEKRDKDED